MGVAQAKPACKHTIATRKCYQYNTIHFAARFFTQIRNSSIGKPYLINKWDQLYKKKSLTTLILSVIFVHQHVFHVINISFVSIQQIVYAWNGICAHMCVRTYMCMG